MKRTGNLILLVLALSGVVVAGCGGRPAVEAKEEAIHIEQQGSGFKTLTLSARAAERLGLVTAPVVDRGPDKVVPYGALIYDAEGSTWVYAGSGGLAFERQAITVRAIDGEEVILSKGPPAGTVVVTVGAAELYGAETGVGGGH